MDFAEHAREFREPFSLFVVPPRKEGGMDAYMVMASTDVFSGSIYGTDQ